MIPTADSHRERPANQFEETRIVSDQTTYSDDPTTDETVTDDAATAEAPCAV